MNQLKEVERAVEKSKKILLKNPKKAKKYKEKYIGELNKSKDFLETYIAYMAAGVQIEADNINLSESIIGKLIRKFDMKVMNKFSSQLSKAKELKKEIEKLEKEFNNIK